MKNKIDIIDSHFHIWDLDRQNLPWLNDNPSIAKSYSINEYENMYKNFDGINFLGGVYVEVDSDNPILEDEIVNEVLKSNDKILARVPRATVSPTMRIPVFANGIREPLHVPSSPKKRCLEDDFVEGIKELSKKNLSFDSCNRVEELGDLVKLMEKVPNAKVVLNHLGNVEKLDDRYKENMRALAKFPNLYVKVSGYPTEDEEFVKELLDFIKETFDSKRLMYASNWPVVEMYSSFDEHLSILLKAFGEDEDFFKNNAKECYNIY